MRDAVKWTCINCTCHVEWILHIADLAGQPAKADKVVVAQVIASPAQEHLTTNNSSDGTHLGR